MIGVFVLTNVKLGYVVNSLYNYPIFKAIIEEYSNNIMVIIEIRNVLPDHGIIEVI